MIYDREIESGVEDTCTYPGAGDKSVNEWIKVARRLINHVKDTNSPQLRKHQIECAERAIESAEKCLKT